MKPTILFDVDDTICVHKNRDYINAKPITHVIRKINYLHDFLGYEIGLYTSRGMGSNNGNVQLADEKNRVVLEEWLRVNNVHYDKLIFGKPLADLYVDDKCLSVNEFMEKRFGHLTSGGSGKDIEQLGNIVRKECNQDEVQQIKYWAEFVERNCNCKTPKIISTLYNYIYMEHIDSINLCDKMSIARLIEVIKTIEEFSHIKHNCFVFDIERPIRVLRKNMCPELEQKIGRCEKQLREFADFLEYKTSFCHGDMILSNILISEDDGELYFIDQHRDEKASCYLLDYAKLFMSLYGYEYMFGITNTPNEKEHLDYFVKYLKTKKIFGVVVTLTYMYMLRLWRYKSEDERKILLEMLDNFEKEFVNGIGTVSK